MQLSQMNLKQSARSTRPASRLQMRVVATAQRSAAHHSATPECSTSISRSRRSALLLGVAGALGVAGVRPALASRPTNKDVDAADSPFIQELLRRTEEKRDERREQRLKDYYRRNFKDYFEFDGGSEEAARARGLSGETQAAIRKWLDDNADDTMPGLRKRD